MAESSRFQQWHRARVAKTRVLVRGLQTELDQVRQDLRLRMDELATARSGGVRTRELRDQIVRLTAYGESIVVALNAAVQELEGLRAGMCDMLGDGKPWGFPDADVVNPADYAYLKGVCDQWGTADYGARQWVPPVMPRRPPPPAPLGLPPPLYPYAPPTPQPPLPPPLPPPFVEEGGVAPMLGEAPPNVRARSEERVRGPPRGAKKPRKSAAQLAIKEREKYGAPEGTRRR